MGVCVEERDEMRSIEIRITIDFILNMHASIKKLEDRMEKLESQSKQTGE